MKRTATIFHIELHPYSAHLVSFAAARDVICDFKDLGGALM
jgi:hypothetical protein